MCFLCENDISKFIFSAYYHCQAKNFSSIRSIDVSFTGVITSSHLGDVNSYEGFSS